MSILLYILLAVAVLIPIYGIFLYNRLVRSRNMVEEGWSGIDVQRQRRADLIPNLVETVKGFATQESGGFQGLADARARALSSGGGIPGRIQAMNSVNRALGAVIAISETYPELRSDARFRALMDELTGTENRLAVERMRFNEAVAAYNTAIRKLPGAMVAGLAGFDAYPQFEAQAGADQAPKVSF